jgi:pimeloyl-ACP methyl ester carboxylesterase
MVALMAEGFQLGVGPSEGPLLQLEARRYHDTSERLGQVRCPTLVCGGRYDGLAPAVNSEFLAKTIPDARLEMFDGGHIFFMQDPTAMPTMLDFLRA